MLQFVTRRLLEAAVVVLLALTAVFSLQFLAGDPVKLFLPTDTTPKQIEEFRARLGLDDPWLVQYVRFMRGALHGDFGRSLRQGEPALALVLERFPATLALSGVAMALALAIAIPVGVLSAARRNSWFDHLGIGATVLGQAVPGFWLGLMLIYVFAVWLKVLPTGGRGTWVHYILPSITLAAFVAARFARLTRSMMLDALGQDYVRTARAKGLGPRRVLYRHALKNASLPIVTLLALQLGQLLGGAVITETIFAWPGVGRFLVQALLNRDFPVVLVGVFLTAVAYSLLNLLADLAYAWLNPRIRYA
ncbi:MAG: ABC transporter permease [Armatimonadota bacterium]|nr:ABC transporter permease [Armatimonadota bacterium]MDR7484779.1 ABC transporter permease [Armatimonadota bacterium]MDR7531894.1 ABC transporter permease [Armatimonadota bacterium]MDR7534761.1 ABC transporter permease [Armatimonadota bacterium]